MGLTEAQDYWGRAMKWTAWIVLGMFLASAAGAEEKSLPAPIAHDILEARWVAVVIYPGSQVPLANPAENQRAVQDVQTAMLKWGRYLVTPDPTQADLIIAVRKGRAGTATINGRKDPTPVILDPSGTGVYIGIHHGQTPPLTRTETSPDGVQHGSVGMQVGPAEDLFEVYRGHTQYPLDEAPVWRYLGKDGLKAPKVEAVAKFRKVVEDAAKKEP
ncbi:MAG: hypothetical protein WCC59_06120 [Terriglobales bacterium]